MWEFYDQQREFVQQILHPIFLYLSFEGSNKTQALAAQLLTMRAELSDNSNIITTDRRLIRSKYQTYLINDDNHVQSERYECLMYLMIQTSLDGWLYIPTSIKYRVLQDDLINDTLWDKKQDLLKNSMLPRLNSKPDQLINSMKQDMEKSYNRSVSR